MIDVQREARRLAKLTVGELQGEHLRVAGETLRSNNRSFLQKRILWKLQAGAFGGLSQRFQAKAAALARESDLRLRPTEDVHAAVDDPVPPPRPAESSPAGSLITKVYRGRRLEVRVLDQGFEYEGEVYRSLSAIAQKVTGAKWNGRLFFGLSGRGGEA